MRTIKQIKFFFVLIGMLMILVNCGNNTKKVILDQQNPEQVVKKFNMALDKGHVDKYLKCFIGSDKHIKIVLKEFELFQGIYKFQNKLRDVYGENAWENYNTIAVSPSLSFPEMFPQNSNWSSGAILKKVSSLRYEWHIGEAKKMILVAKKDNWFIDLYLTFGDENLNSTEKIRYMQKVIDTLKYGKDLASPAIALPVLKNKIGEYMWGDVMYRK